MFLTEDSGRVVPVMLFVEGGQVLVGVAGVISSWMLIAPASPGS